MWHHVLPQSRHNSNINWRRESCHWRVQMNAAISSSSYMIYNIACHKICGYRHRAGAPDDTKWRNPHKKDHLKERNQINMVRLCFSKSASRAIVPHPCMPLVILKTQWVTQFKGEETWMSFNLKNTSFLLYFKSHYIFAKRFVNLIEIELIL